MNLSPFLNPKSRINPPDSDLSFPLPCESVRPETPLCVKTSHLCFTPRRRTLPASVDNGTLPPSVACGMIRRQTALHAQSLEHYTNMEKRCQIFFSIFFRKSDKNCLFIHPSTSPWAQSRRSAPLLRTTDTFRTLPWT